MKWTMIAVTMIGAVTYAVIFLAQSQHETQDDAALAADVPSGRDEIVVDDASSDLARVFPTTKDDSVATLERGEVSNPVTEPIEDATTVTWQGDPWPVGVEAFEQGDHELARAALEAAVQEKENSPYRHYLLGLTYRRVGETEKAVSEFERSVELAPGQIRAFVNLSRAYLDLQDAESARAAVDEALEIDLEYADAWHVLGRVELAQQKFEEAAAAFAKAVSKDPTHAWAWNNLGYARIQLEQFEDAVSPLRHALGCGIEEAVFYNNLGVALERTGHEDLAAIAYARAVVLGHGPAEASHERVEEIVVARGGTPVDFDAIESLDAEGLLALIPDPDSTAVAVDDPTLEESLTALELQGLEEFDEELIGNR